jgi:hypothetical protein
MKRWNYIDTLAIIFFLIGLLILIIIPFMEPYRGNLPIDSRKASDFGQFVGGYFGSFFMLMSVVILILTLSYQLKSNHIQQFSIKYLDLIKLHRDNVSELTLQNKNQRSVFIILHAEFQDIYEIVEKSSKKWKEIDIAVVAYTILYFGIGEISTPMVISILENFDSDVLNNIISKIDEYRIPKGYKNLKYLKKFKLGDYLPFNGHQSRLGHYYRHIFQTIKFIDTQDYLSNKEKKEYAKTLRAQLSNHELALFFYNSLSPMGSTWRDNNTFDDNKKSVSYMVKYEFIKNIPLKGFTYKLNPEDFVEIEYEWNEIKAVPSIVPLLAKPGR